MYEMITSWTQRHSSLARDLLPAAARTLSRDDDEAEAERADLLVIADGLQRLLANCAEEVAQRHLPAVLQAHRALRVQLRLRLSPSLPAQLLSDLCHEVAEFAEAAPALQAALRCLHRAALRRAAAA
jgi:hypothetical protein